MKELYRSDGSWDIEQGDYKRIVEAGRGYRNYGLYKKISNRIYAGVYILTFITFLYTIMHYVAK